MTREINVYLETGVVYVYSVTGETEESVQAKAREHASEIIRGGYRHNDGHGNFEHFGPHRISKVKITGGVISTDYPDGSRGT
jgi:hypothetical protein